MILFLIRRLIQLLVTLLILSFVSFAVMRLAPGDPVRAVLRVEDVAVTGEQVESLRQELQLHQPVWIQYLNWMKRMVHLDFGHSLILKQPVADMILERAPATFSLMAGGILFMILLAFPLGVLGAYFRGSVWDHLSRLFSLAGASVPSFWLGLLLIHVLAYEWNLLPSQGNGGPEHLILPSLTLGLAMAAVYARMFRASLLETLSRDYIQAAYARGLPPWIIFWRHVLKESCIPILSLLSISIGSLFAGTIVVEILFSRPGLGKMVVDAILRRDFPVIQGYIMTAVVFVFIIHTVMELLAGAFDPRAREGRDGYEM
ncbi:nickel ABC transporter permease [Lihuaxuella thermophila]|uniref:Nickel import system permease protein NikB n=1 Tax=Lihuaxuella thermophila TaxID=1173111 RepID=A0A1H8BI60_9BACL|nr:nickel ABC transporter permease [Lihuaxuella thermophila]SEM82503.1 peptide/nickel transport system permease protein [Lihuaxuella thermophila]